jgi:hypothetical protein
MTNPKPGKDWSERILTSSPNYRCEINGQEMGLGGNSVYNLYTFNSNEHKAATNFDQAGRFKITSDQVVEISAGAKSSKKNDDIVITSLDGNVTITATDNGVIKIKGANIVLDSAGDIDILAGRNIKLKGTNVDIEANAANTTAMKGNMIPFSEEWIAKVFSNTYVGADVIAGFIGRATGLVK